MSSVLPVLPCAALFGSCGSGSEKTNVIAFLEDSLAEMWGEREGGRGIIEGSGLPLLIQAMVGLAELIVRLSLSVRFWVESRKEPHFWEETGICSIEDWLLGDHGFLMTFFLKMLENEKLYGKTRALEKMLFSERRRPHWFRGDSGTV